MRTAAICPTCATYENALCILYNGPYLPYTTIQPLDSLEVALQKIDAAFVTPVTSVSGTNPIIVTGTYTPVISILQASATQEGTVTTGTQSFAGAKTFLLDIIVNGITVGQGNTSSTRNTAVGSSALSSSTTGVDNVALGYIALENTTIGSSNVAVGSGSINSNISGDSNTAVGTNSLFSNLSGGNNTAIGQSALSNITTGDNNTAIGNGAGQGISTGSGNTIIGGNIGGLSASLSDTVIIGNSSGNVRITVNSAGITNIANVPTYADNAAALTAGLVAGDIYRTGDTLKIVH